MVSVSALPCSLQGTLRRILLPLPPMLSWEKWFPFYSILQSPFLWGRSKASARTAHWEAGSAVVLHSFLPLCPEFGKAPYPLPQANAYHSESQQITLLILVVAFMMCNCFPSLLFSFLIYLLLKRRMPSEIDGLEQRTAKSKALMCSCWLLWSLSHGGFRRQLQGEGNSLHLKNRHFQSLLKIRRSGKTDFEFPQGNDGWGHGKALWFPSLHKACFPHLLAEPWQDLGLLPWADVGEGSKTRAPRLTARPKASFHDALHSSSGKSHSKANRLVSSSHWIYPH